MQFFYQLLNNEILLASFFGWLIAQILKTFIYVAVNKSFNPERLLGDGGMPSSHSATVMALVTATGLNFGADTFQFAIAAVVALITMHDAMGVRRETGKQAVAINNIMEWFLQMGSDIAPEQKLKEFVGHTPLQVFFGALLGILVGFVVCAII